MRPSRMVQRHFGTVFFSFRFVCLTGGENISKILDGWRAGRLSSPCQPRKGHQSNCFGNMYKLETDVGI